MVGIPVGDQPAVLFKSGLVHIPLDGKVGQNCVITGMVRDIGIGKHTMNFVLVASVVPFIIALKRIIGVVVQIDGYLQAGSTRHVEHQKIAAVVLACLYVFLLQDVCTAMGLVVHIVPEHLFVLAYLLLRDAVERKPSVLLLDTQHDDPTLRVGKSGVGLPKTARKTAFGGLKLHVYRLIVGRQRFDLGD